MTTETQLFGPFGDSRTPLLMIPLRSPQNRP
jgi:hypothetical protein